jgi:hypothetical protein
MFVFISVRPYGLYIFPDRERKRSINRLVDPATVERSSSAHDQSEHRKHKHNRMVLEVDEVAMRTEDGNSATAAKLL